MADGRAGRPELAEIFRTHGAAFLTQHSLSSAQARAWRAIVGCRTQALGGYREACDRCGGVRQVFHPAAIAIARSARRAPSKRG